VKGKDETERDSCKEGGVAWQGGAKVTTLGERSSQQKLMRDRGRKTPERCPCRILATKNGEKLGSKTGKREEK